MRADEHPMAAARRHGREPLWWIAWRTDEADEKEEGEREGRRKGRRILRKCCGASLRFLGLNNCGREKYMITAFWDPQPSY